MSVRTDGDRRKEAARASGGERVTFQSQGETLVGRLFQPSFRNGPAPGVAILGPMTFVR